MPRRREWWRFSQPLCHLLALLLTLFALAGRASAGNKARGISPLDLAYFQETTIWCKDGVKSFPRERLNDNFCDCADGTDEPGTSACPDSKFYCKNVGADPILLYSSRVNDGICDCCDGSDEYEKRVDCVNTCGGAIEDVSETSEEKGSEKSEEKVSEILEDNASEKLEEDSGQSTTFDTDDVSEVVPDKEQKKFGEDLVSKLKEMNAVMLLVLWLPLFALLSLFGWIWARGPRRLPFRQRRVSRPSLV